MQTIIMTVGTSLMTNKDPALPEAERRPWKHPARPTVADALVWMSKTDPEVISAETNTLLRLDVQPDAEIMLLHSDTEDGKHCAKILEEYFRQKLGQKTVRLNRVPAIDYDSDAQESALRKMASLLCQLIDNAMGNVVLAATGGFKSEAMIVAMVGQTKGIPVCYVHEQHKSLVYLPLLRLDNASGGEPVIRKAALPASGRNRSEVMQISNVEHHRPRVWPKVERMLLRDLPWIDAVRFDKQAFNAPRNGVKSALRRTDDGRHVLWLRVGNGNDEMAVSIETTGHTPEHLEQASEELRERLGGLL